MEWIVGHLGGFGKWLYYNPVALVTLGLLAALLFLAISVIRTEFNPPTSVIVDVNRRPYISPPKVIETTLLVMVIIAFAGFLVYGTMKYLAMRSTPIVTRYTKQQNDSKENEGPTPIKPASPSRATPKSKIPKKESVSPTASAIEIVLDCSDSAALPLKISIGKSVYIGFINNHWPEYLPISYYRITNIDGPRAKFWPSQGLMDYANKQAPGKTFYATRCDIANHGSEDIAELTIPFKTSFWIGVPNYQYRKTTVVLGPVDKGKSTSFYLVNDCPLIAAVAIPETGTARMIGDETKQPFKLEQMNAQKLVAFNLGVSPIVWSQASSE